VAEVGSFTAAAATVSCSQSAVSQKVLRLEDMLGRRLFVRSSRSLQPTRAEEHLLVAARRMLEFNDALIRDVREPPATGVLGSCGTLTFDNGICR
jgi:DNA-binding transcriptional LysR family regulator